MHRKATSHPGVGFVPPWDGLSGLSREHDAAVTHGTGRSHTSLRGTAVSLCLPDLDVRRVPGTESHTPRLLVPSTA